MNWFRFYHGALHDPKVQALRPELFKFWVNLLCLVSQQPDRGIIPSDEEIAFIMRVRGDRVTRFMSELQAYELVDMSVSNVRVPHNWSVRQPLSDDAAARKKDWRERTYSKNGNYDVTGHVPARAREEQEQEADPETALASGPPARPPPAGRSGDHESCITEARALFGDAVASDVAAKGRDIEREMEGQFECYRMALRKIAAELRTPGAKPVRNVHALALKIGKRYLRDGIEAETVGAGAQGSTMAEKAERLKKRWAGWIDKEQP